MNEPPAAQEEAPRPWYRRRNLAIAAAVVLVLLVTILIDLPVGTSRAQDLADERAVVRQLNGDLAPCALAVHQALGIWELRAANRLTASQRAGTAGLLSDDQAACSFTDQSIFDLSTIEAPGTPAGRHLRDVVSSVTLWTTSDALHAVEDVQALMADPTDGQALHSLGEQERRLGADRRAALAELDAADAELGARLPAPGIPKLPLPAGG